jgi:hypothetical protein
MSQHRADRDRPLAVMAFLGSALLAAFWALYLAGAIALGEPGSAVADFEAAFPFADALAAGLLVAAGVALWQGRPAGRFVMTAAAAMVLYLGVLDLTFYSRQGFFTRFGGEAALELALISACLGGGAFALLRCRRLGRATPQPRGQRRSS